MAQLLMTIVAASIALAYAVVALVWPHSIQKWWISQRLRKLVARKIYGLFVESPRYIIYLRMTGVVSLIVSLFLFYSARRLMAPYLGNRFQDSSNILHNLLFHKGLKYLLFAVLIAGIYLITKLADRGRRGKRKVPKVPGVNRQRRRELSSMNRRGRRH